jgi:hypothetical protein
MEPLHHRDRFALLALLIAGALSAGALSAQAATQYRPTRIQSEVAVDGLLDEPAWQTAAVMALEFEWSPGANLDALVQTQAWLAYDESHLYIAFRASDPDPAAIRAHLMDRDSLETFLQDDHVIVMIDTFDDARRAYQFRVNPFGVQVDGFFSDLGGGEPGALAWDSADFSWDATWISAGKTSSEGYVVELALPFDQLRYPGTPGAQAWGLQLSRSYPRDRRHLLGAGRFDQDRSCVLCQSLKLEGLQLDAPGRGLELAPTLTAQSSSDSEAARRKLEAGFTARYAPTPELALSATVNPDFSQLEVDAAQLDVNTRFALFFPEKRLFFLEGADLLETDLNLLFTRTIVDPRAGVKLFGKLGGNAVAAFFAEDSTNNLLIPSNQGSSTIELDARVRNSVLRYRRDVSEGSTLGGLLVERSADGYLNRVAAVDTFLRFGAAHTLSAQASASVTQYPDELQALELDQPSGRFSGQALSMTYRHNSRDWDLFGHYELIDPQFRADAGFLPRVDLQNSSFLVSRSFWGRPEQRWTRVLFGLFAEDVRDYGGAPTDHVYALFVDLYGPRQSKLGIDVSTNAHRVAEAFHRQLYQLRLTYEIQPTSLVKLATDALLGEDVDYDNNQRAGITQLISGLELKPGARTNLRLDHTLLRLTVDPGTLLVANLVEWRMVYQFSLRASTRVTLQRHIVTRDPARYLEPVEARSDAFGWQWLLSYRIAPQTAFFLGASKQDPELQTGLETSALAYAWNL